MDRRVLKRWWNYSALIKSNEKETSASFSFIKTVCQHHVAGSITECLNLRRIYWRQSHWAHFYGFFTYALPLIVSSRLCAFSPALTNWANWVNWDWWNIYAPVEVKDAASRLSLASFPCYVRIGAWGFLLIRCSRERRNCKPGRVFSTLTERIDNISPTCHNLGPRTANLLHINLTGSRQQLANEGVLATPLLCSWLQRSSDAVRKTDLLRAI